MDDKRITTCARCKVEFDSLQRGKTRRADIYCSIRCADLDQPDTARVTETEVERALEAVQGWGMLDTRRHWTDGDRAIVHEILATSRIPSAVAATGRTELETDRLRAAHALADKIICGHVFDAAHEVYTACKTLALGLKVQAMVSPPSTVRSITDTTLLGKTPRADAIVDRYLELCDRVHPDGSSSEDIERDLRKPVQQLEIELAHAAESAQVNSRLASQYLDELEALRTASSNAAPQGQGRDAAQDAHAPAAAAPESSTRGKT